MWDPALYERSIRFAAEWHGNQQMSTSQLPYVVHLAQVAHRVLWGLQCDGQPAEVINVALQVALLHDVLEDTACTREHLVATFGETVTAAVDALSKEVTSSGKRHYRDSESYLQGLAAASSAARAVKLADRITNLQTPPWSWFFRFGKIESYQRESQSLLERCGTASNRLARALTERIEAYSSYCTGPGDWPIFTQRKALPFAQPIRVAGCFQPQALALEDGPLVLAGQSVDAELDQHCVAAGVLLEEGFYPLFLTPTVAASGSLDSAYRETSYCAEGVPIRIGQKHPLVDRLLEKHQAQAWGFVSAWNPDSQILSSAENNSRDHQLQQLIGERWPIYRGYGVPHCLDWIPEASWLVVGCSRADALQIARHFGQRAIVYGEVRGDAELIFC